VSPHDEKRMMRSREDGRREARLLWIIPALCGPTMIRDVLQITWCEQTGEHFARKIGSQQGRRRFYCTRASADN
jgi:hypothetical protein